MNHNDICFACDLYIRGHCAKWRKNGKCNPSSAKWFEEGEFSEPKKFIPLDRMCRESSIFGNDYIGLTESDIEKLKNGKVIHIPGEYGIFIGFVDTEVK